MNDEVFSDFTNKVVRLSNASLDEQKVLFWRLNLGEQAEIYDARQRDALPKVGEWQVHFITCSAEWSSCKMKINNSCFSGDLLGEVQFIIAKKGRWYDEKN